MDVVLRELQRFTLKWFSLQWNLQVNTVHRQQARSDNFNVIAEKYENVKIKLNVQIKLNVHINFWSLKKSW